MYRQVKGGSILNKIIVSENKWILQHKDTYQEFFGETDKKAEKLLEVLENNPDGGIIDKEIILTTEQGIYSLDQWLTEKLNRPFVQGTSEDFTALEKELPWVIEYYGYTPGKDEYSIESLLTVGNGFLGLRGTTPEMDISDENYPALYLASLYNTADSEVSGQIISNEDFVNAPNLQKMYLIIDDERIDIAKNKMISIKRSLNLKTGLFQSQVILETKNEKQIEICTKKIANMADIQQYSLSYTFTPLNFSGTVQFVSEADGDVYNYNVSRYRSLTNKHLTVKKTIAEKQKAALIAETNQSKITIVQSSELFSADIDLTQLACETTQDKVLQSISLDVSHNQSYSIEKTVSVQQYRENETVPSLDLTSYSLPTFSTSYQASRSAWETLWEDAAIKVTGDLMSQKMLNLHTYHLLTSASPNAYRQSLDASITARGLHGEAYRGHIFWDELFILPFYIIHFPETAKEILLYRYRRLQTAKENAQEAGYQGAMFPWQSGLDGSEQSQKLHLNPLSGKWKEDHSRLQRHVSLAIAYNVWQYWHNTCDDAFMENYGLEIILEVAHFWQSKAVWDTTAQRYSIDKVMGPDEFHESYPNAEQGGLKNNAYTNMMVVWLFEEIEGLQRHFSSEVFQNALEKTDITKEVLENMQDVRKKLALEIDPEGIIAQFEGYFSLKDLDWTHYKETYGNIYRMDRILNAEGKSADDYKVAKQADSLMIFYNFSTQQVNQILSDLDYDLPLDYVEKNLHYYLKRTSHGSTLSRVVHAQLAAMVHQQDLAWQLYQEALYSDYRDIQGGTTAEGIHAGVMAATLFIPLTTFAGMDIREDTLYFSPNMPQQWQNISFKTKRRNIDFWINVTHETITVKASKSAEIMVLNQSIALEANQEKTIFYSKETVK